MPALPDRISGSIKRGQEVIIVGGPVALPADDRFCVAFVDAVGIALLRWPNAGHYSFDTFIPWTSLDYVTVVPE